jgi:hypothetical protein
VAIGPDSKTVWSPSSIACPTGFHRVDACVGRTAVNINQKWRPSDRRREGRKMERMESFIHGIGRFVFGLGVGLALTSVYVIVTSAPDLMATRTGAGDVVLLEPVVVTISAARFDAIRTEAAPASRPVHLFGRGPQQIRVEPS